jgi:hypothetical protein
MTMVNRISYQKPKPECEARWAVIVQFVCKANDPEIMRLFRITDHELSALKAHTAWDEQLRYLSSVEADPALLRSSEDCVTAVLDTITLGPKGVQPKVFNWYFPISCRADKRDWPQQVGRT